MGLINLGRLNIRKRNSCASALIFLSDVQPPSVYKSHILNGPINKLYISLYQQLISLILLYIKFVQISIFAEGWGHISVLLFKPLVHVSHSKFSGTRKHSEKSPVEDELRFSISRLTVFVYSIVKLSHFKCVDNTFLQ